MMQHVSSDAQRAISFYVCHRLARQVSKGCKRRSFGLPNRVFMPAATQVRWLLWNPGVPSLEVEVAAQHSSADTYTWITEFNSGTSCPASGLQKQIGHHARPKRA